MIYDRYTPLVTIDFWGTIANAQTGGDMRRQVRHDALCEVAWKHMDDLPEHNIEAAVQHASDSFNRIWLNDHRTPLTGELVDTILDHIGDRVDTDIKGAKSVGMKAIRFTGISGRKDVGETDIAPDYI